MSMMLVRVVTGRTLIITLACGMSFLLQSIPGGCSVGGQGAGFVREHVHEVSEARNVEDLHVVLAEATGEQAPVRLARPREQADDQGDASAVDVVNVGKVEQDGVWRLALGLGVGGVQRLFGEGVDLAVQLDDGDTWAMVANTRLKHSGWHWCLLLETWTAPGYGGSHHPLRASRQRAAR